MIYLQTSSSCLQNLRWGTDMGLIVHIWIQWLCSQVSYRISTSSQMMIPMVLPIETPLNATVAIWADVEIDNASVFNVFLILASSVPLHLTAALASPLSQVNRRVLNAGICIPLPPTQIHHLPHTHYALGETRRSKQPDGCLKPIGLQR